MRLADDNIGIVVLAAGVGRRMDRQPKLLLPMKDGKRILWHAVNNALCWQPSELLVVVRPDLPRLTQALSDLPVRCIENPRYLEGIGTSLAVGIAALGPEIRATFVLLADQPAVPSKIIEHVVEAYRQTGKLIVVPRYGDRIGPPTLFSSETFQELFGLSGDIGGRQIILRDPERVHTVSFLESERPVDIDTPDDYIALR